MNEALMARGIIPGAPRMGPGIPLIFSSVPASAWGGFEFPFIASSKFILSLAPFGPAGPRISLKSFKLFGFSNDI